MIFFEILAKLNEIQRWYARKDKNALKKAQILIEEVKNSVHPEIFSHIVPILDRFENTQVALNAKPAGADRFGKYFKEDVYQQLLPYTQLAQYMESSGDAQEQALKLTVLFGDTEAALKYLLNRGCPVHEACLFELPNVVNCQFHSWQKHAKKSMQDARFRKLLPDAEAIEKLMKSSQKSKPDYNKINEKKKQIGNVHREWKNLKRKHGTLSNEEKAQYQRLSKELLQLNEELVSLCINVSLENADMIILEAFHQHYINQTSFAYQYFLQHGLTTKDYDKFTALCRDNAGKNIPDVLLEGSTIGYPGYYLMKIPVLDESHAARAACLGKLTDCCQSLSGEAGEPCVIHGLTDPNSGFYVLCKGDSANPQVSDEVIGQTWVWRSQNDALVFDSIEISEPANTEIAKDFYRIVARDLVSKGFTHKVNCGSLSGISREVGVGEKLGIAEEKFIDYAGYSDSSSQLVLFDKITPFYWYGQDHWYWYGKDTQYTKLKNALFKEELILSEHLANSKLLGHVINWALLHNRKDILDGLQEIAQTVDRSDELHVLINSMKQFIDSPNNFEVEKFVLNNQYYVDTVNSNGNTLLMQACFKGNDKLVYLLSEKGTDVNLINKSGETALHIAASSKTIDKGVITKLIEKGAKINTEDNFGATPLMRAIINKNGTHKVQELLARGADVKAKDHYGNAALMYAAKCGNSAIIPALVQRGAYIDDCDFSGDTPLITAIKKDDVACVVELINNGADVTMQDNVPLTWAECMDNAEIINIIKEKIYEVVKRKTLLFSNNMQPNRAYLSPLDAHDEEDNTRVAEFQIE